MLDLSTPKAPFDIVLPYGLLVTVTTADGRGPARRRAVEAIERPKRPASRSTSSSVAERH